MKLFCIFLIFIMIFSSSCGKKSPTKLGSNQQADQLAFRTDLPPIQKRIKNIPSILKVKWLGELTGIHSRLSPPQSQSYRMYGYIMCSIEDIENLMLKYKWDKLGSSWSPEFIFSEAANVKSSHWFHSTEFDKSAKSELLVGSMYVNAEKGLIYFDLEGE